MIDKVKEQEALNFLKHPLAIIYRTIIPHNISIKEDVGNPLEVTSYLNLESLIFNTMPEEIAEEFRESAVSVIKWLKIPDGTKMVDDTRKEKFLWNTGLADKSRLKHRMMTGGSEDTLIWRALRYQVNGNTITTKYYYELCGVFMVLDDVIHKIGFERGLNFFEITKNELREALSVETLTETLSAIYQPRNEYIKYVVKRAKILYPSFSQNCRLMN